MERERERERESDSASERVNKLLLRARSFLPHINAFLPACCSMCVDGASLPSFHTAMEQRHRARGSALKMFARSIICALSLFLSIIIPHRELLLEEDHVTLFDASQRQEGTFLCDSQIKACFFATNSTTQIVMLANIAPGCRSNQPLFTL